MLPPKKRYDHTLTEAGLIGIASQNVSNNHTVHDLADKLGVGPVMTSVKMPTPTKMLDLLKKSSEPDVKMASVDEPPETDDTSSVSAHSSRLNQVSLVRAYGCGSE